MCNLLPLAGAAVRYHFLSVAVCVFACLLICRCLYVSNGLSVCMSMFVSIFVCQWSVGRRSVCLSASVYLFLYAFASVYLRLFVFVYPSASIYLLFASVYLPASVIYLSLYASVYRIYLRLSATASVSIWPGVCLSVGLPVYRSVGNHSVCLFVACLSVASLCAWLRG